MRDHIALAFVVLWCLAVALTLAWVIWGGLPESAVQHIWIV